MAKQGWFRSLAATLGLGLVALLALVSRPQQATAAEDFIRTPLGAWQEGCDYQCRECGDNKHDIVVGVNNDATSSHLENCNVGDCTSHSCNITFLEVDRVSDLWDRLTTAGGADVEQLVDTNRDMLFLNAERRSVQFYCAKGLLIANLPLSERQRSDLQLD